jgi:hypothetical protein
MLCSSVVDIPTQAASSETQAAKLARKNMWRSLINLTPNRGGKFTATMWASALCECIDQDQFCKSSQTNPRTILTVPGIGYRIAEV